MSCNDFTKLSKEDFAKFIASNKKLFGEAPSEGAYENVLAALEMKGTRILPLQQGFAIVREAPGACKSYAVLWYIYSEPKSKTADRLIPLARQVYPALKLSLGCYGAKRRERFATSGFVVDPESCKGDFYCMSAEAWNHVNSSAVAVPTHM